MSAALPSSAPALPEVGFVRLSQIIGNPKAKPPIPALIPISKSQWWRWVAEGKAPAPVKLSPMVTVWKNSSIRALIERLGSDQKAA